MKAIWVYLIMGILLTSCTTYNEVGRLNVLSDRQVDANAKYQRLTTGSGSTKKEIRKSEALTIQQAIDQVLDQVPGGAYLTNVKIYVVKGDCIAVAGDVWGKVAEKQTPVSTKTVCNSKPDTNYQVEIDSFQSGTR